MDKYAELNAQLDAIRENPLLILEADEETLKVGANVNIHYDWLTNPKAWKIIEYNVKNNMDNAFSEMELFIHKYEKKLEELEKSAISDAQLNSYCDHCDTIIHNFLNYDDTFYREKRDIIECADPAELLKCDDIKFIEFFRESLIEEANNSKKEMAKDTYYKVSILETNEARKIGLKLNKKTGQWHLSADADQKIVDQADQLFVRLGSDQIISGRIAQRPASLPVSSVRRSASDVALEM